VRRDQLRGLLIPSKDFYAIADLPTARRIGGVLWIVGAALVAAVAPIAEPTRHVGGGGWAVAAGFVVISLALAWRLFSRPERVTPNELLLQSYLAISAIALMQWIGGPPYAELLLLPALYVGAVHPPRRVVPFLVTLGVLAYLPEIYDGWSSTRAAETATRLLLWCGLAAVAMLFTASVRSNRLRLAQRGEEARRQARVDALTGLGNRRAFDEAVARALPGSRRSDRPFSIVITDLDDFKAINDRYGHTEGDRCLREVAEAFRAAVRAPDACFRWGGDEFALVLPATDQAAARVVGARVREMVRRSVVLSDGEPLQLRFGAAEFEEGMDAEELLAAADLALMSARLTVGEERTPPAAPAQDP
jgi:diguanylate cyclase (GGDEF)-like protein